MEKFEYSKRITPPRYVCDNCSAKNCKLWRETNIFYPQLLCCDCAAENQNEDIYSINDLGILNVGLKNETNLIGEYIPAIPVENGIGFHTNFPESGFIWWENLPLRQIK